MILTAVWIAAVSCACGAGTQDCSRSADEIVPTVADGWVVEADDYEAAYTGVPVANGILGILPWKEPFSVRHRLTVLSGASTLSDFQWRWTGMRNMVSAAGDKAST